MGKQKEGPGHIYLFSNRQWGSLWWSYYKIGETSRNIKSRLKDYKTYSPFPTLVEYSIETSKRITAEKAIHIMLSKYHMDKGGGVEFFRVSKRKIKRVMKRVVRFVEEGRIYMNEGKVYKDGHLL